MAQSREAVQAYCSLLAQATIPLILGSFKSLKTPESTKQLRRSRLKARQTIPDPDEDEAYDDENALDETLTWADTLIFPVFGSIALLSLWLVIKYAGKEWINFFMGIYFSGAGMFAIQDTLGSILHWILPKVGYKSGYYHIRISSSFKQVFHSRISVPTLLLLPLSIGAPLLYIPLARHYLLSNLIALCLATSTLSILKLDSFLTAIVLLSALLVYDIFWVFATPVMVDVATSIDAPIKLLAPRSASGKDFALLGLGDIVIPGLMISLCLRFDLYRYAKFNPDEEVTSRSKFNRSYFLVGMASYVAGLGGCMWIMSYFGRAQPALLYLSPACIIGPLLFALLRGEFPLLWSFSDSPTDADAAAIKDDTIEAPSEAAQRARAEAKARASNGVGSEQPLLQTGDSTPAEPELEVDDSWMNGPVGAPDADGKARRRKNKKK